MDNAGESGEGSLIHNNREIMEESAAGEDSFISPFNSPVKDARASGDFVVSGMDELENKQSMANQLVQAFDSTEEPTQDKILPTFQSDILEEMKKVSENTVRCNTHSEDASSREVSPFAKGDAIGPVNLEDKACHNQISQDDAEVQDDAKTDGIQNECGKFLENPSEHHHTEVVSYEDEKGEIADEEIRNQSIGGVGCEHDKSNTVVAEQNIPEEVECEDVAVDVLVPDIPYVPNGECEKENATTEEGEKDRIIAEMMASAAETVANQEMSHREMMSVSKKMEEEFRSMMIKEQQLKKLAMEGATYASPSEVSNKALDTAKEVTSNKEKKRVSRIPETTKTAFKPAKSTTPRRTTPSSKSSTPSRTSVQKTSATRTATTTSTPSRPKPANTANRSTPTTIKITPDLGVRTTNSASAGERRTNTPQHKSIISKSSPAISTPKSSRQGSAIVTVTRTPRSTPVKSPTLSTPNRPLSAQSSEAARSRAKMPDTKNVQSKIGSMQNARHTPGGGKVRIESKKTDYSKVTSKIGSRANMTHTPTGGKVKIESKKVDYSNVSSKCGSLANTKYTPGGGKVKIEHKKLDFRQVTSKCGSRDNLTHTPGGGKVKVESKRLDFSNVTSKCGSKSNIKHVPQGGNVRIYHEKVDTSTVQSKIGSKDNIDHTPGGGKVKIVSKTLDLSNVKSKCGSMENADHVAGGGSVVIFDEKPVFKDKVQSKVGSLENADHIAGGGDVRIYDEKVSFKESAAARTNHGFNGTGSVGSSGSVSST